jgi:hypothetical protein
VSFALSDVGLEPIPDLVEPIEAWRVWRVAVCQGRVVLTSVFTSVIWEPAVPLAASCSVGHRSLSRPWRVELNDHPAPDLDCRCGIYGVPSAAGARPYLERPPVLCRDERVIGRVALWGDVVEGQSGWRASHAYPVELFVPLPPVVQKGLRRRAYAEEIRIALEEYRVPVDLVATSALAAY